MKALLLALLGCSAVPNPGIRVPTPGIPPTYWTAESPRECPWARPAVLCADLERPAWDGRYWHCPTGPKQ